MKKIESYILAAALALLVASSCHKEETVASTPEDSLTGREIHVGGILTDGSMFNDITATKAKEPDAADVLLWLREPLSQGLDIKYWWGKDSLKTVDVAVLKLLMNGSDPQRDDNGLPKYSFKYKDSESNAQWYGNGGHFFQATFATGRLINDVPEDLSSDQHNDDTTEVGKEGNYTLLERYLAMPAGDSLTAVTSRIGLPFTRRLSRVLFYILIDPNLIDPATSKRPTLKGYDATSGKDDPRSTSLRFKDVMVLKKANLNSGVLTPEWTEVHEVIPHSIGEMGSIGSKGEVLVDTSCILYYHRHKRYYITPCNSEWKTARDIYRQNPDTCYSKISYGKVPCYDIILRPTYTKAEKVMYDEEVKTASLVNSFVASMELSNGHKFVSNVNVDLDAGFQASVFIRLNLGEVNFETATIEKWTETESSNRHYGVNSEENHNLSYAGSTWQRAYRMGSVNPDEVSDGHGYTGNQYLTQVNWINKLKQACKDSVCHGDYFILEEDITINTDVFPNDFIFTGHLDAMGHKITLSGSKKYLFYGIDGIYETRQESDMTATWEANVHLENTKWVPVKGYRAEVMNLVIDGGTLASDSTRVTGYVKNCRKADGTKIEYANPGIPQY